ncbi:MAG: DUF262 domain-containing protein [Butyrivibrio sp.]|nr:DUF262 domain-containing protein [Butyrivibrio sp.]
MEKFLSTSLKNIAWFNDMNKAGKIEIKPPFQRNPVWTEKQKSYLIDSVLNGYPIPELYIQEVVDEEGNSNYKIVDGQQRMRSVLEFLDDKFGMNREDSPQFDGAHFKDLTPDQKRAFYGYNFVVRSLPDMPDSDIREIFKRLNRNVVSLNTQELRKAIYSGPFIQLVSDLSERDFWGQLRFFTANDVKRMKDEEYISELCLVSLEGIQNKKDRIEKFYQEAETEFVHSEELNRTFDRVLGFLEPMAQELSHTRWRNKTDFYTLFYALSKKQTVLPSADSYKITEVKNALTNFSDKVNEFLEQDNENTESFTQNVKNYAKGVRAATDSTARTSRQTALDEFLAHYLP